MFKNYVGSRFVVWIKIEADPHVNFRGFSILGRELRVIGFEPIQDTMRDLRGQEMQGRFWAVEEAEVYRVIPEMLRFPVQNKPWLFPVEFCNPFVRPYYYVDTPQKDVELLWED